MVKDETVGMGRVWQVGDERGGDARGAERMVGNARVGEGSGCVGT